MDSLAPAGEGGYTYCMPAKLGGQVVGVHVSDYPSRDHLRSQWDCGDICNYSCKLNVCVFTAALREVNGQRRVGAPVASPAVARGVPSEVHSLNDVRSLSRAIHSIVHGRRVVLRRDWETVASRLRGHALALSSIGKVGWAGLWVRVPGHLEEQQRASSRLFPHMMEGPAVPLTIKGCQHGLSLAC